MDSKEIRELIELISESSVSKFEMEREGLKLKVIKERPVVAAPAPAPAVVQPAPAATLPGAAPVELPAAPPVAEPAVGVEITAPIVGTFYRSPSPEAAMFVEVGSKVSKGQVLCIIEAMKVMNEIEAEVDGEILEILVADGQPVEYGESMFRLQPQ